ncbi:NACHT, LRR and PYD domains-containing protein 12-like [Amblyraja radiata]|uniref:NACHT, LRR and PYD domains-containing protein 12-like n=1 Tax=Amblyraja radiata TaxID=386614 RepID=UPI0014028676|nr:NACHT, LRR and PYD domains-containing protein 12-like [Amblyraja radiata]
MPLTGFYRDRLEQTMERGVHGLSSALTYENHLSGREHWEITELADRGEHADSSKLLLKLVMSRGPQACRVMWNSFVKMRNAVPKLDRLLKEIQELGSVPFVHGYTMVDFKLRDVQQKHKETLRAQTETLRVNTLLKMEVQVLQLVDLYAELTIISSVQVRRLVEHELLARGRDHEEYREKCLQRELEKIRIDQLFYSCFFWNRSRIGSLAAVAGAPGIGKTTMVQKFVHDWATGKTYQHFQFVFSFRLRDLNSIKSRVTLKELILEQYPYFGNILSKVGKNPAQLLFIFDGLD